MNKLPPLFRLLGTAHALEARLEDRLAPLSLSLAKLGVLRVLAEGGEALPLSELAGKLGCVRSNMTQLIDRLEKDGWVRRAADADDRRVQRATLTPAGRRVYTAGKRVLAAEERAVAAALSGADTAALDRMLGRIGKR
jgi:DNA-binding MarR family transcriptional regulator